MKNNRHTLRCRSRLDRRNHPPAYHARNADHMLSLVKPGAPSNTHLSHWSHAGLNGWENGPDQNWQRMQASGGTALPRAARLISQQPDLDYLTLDYLAEVSMSIMAIQREKDPTEGYATRFSRYGQALINPPLWKAGSRVKVVTNAGGLNPRGCAHACRKLLAKRKRLKRMRDCGWRRRKGLPLIGRGAKIRLFRNLETGSH